jgi:hypothetical protein
MFVARWILPFVSAAWQAGRMGQKAKATRGILTAYHKLKIV